MLSEVVCQGHADTVEKRVVSSEAGVTPDCGPSQNVIHIFVGHLLHSTISTFQDHTTTGRFEQSHTPPNASMVSWAPSQKAVAMPHP